MVSCVCRRERGVRPRMEMLRAPDLAKERTVSCPIPEPPPDMTMFLPLVVSCGRVGLMDG